MYLIQVLDAIEIIFIFNTGEEVLNESEIKSFSN